MLIYYINLVTNKNNNKTNVLDIASIAVASVNEPLTEGGKSFASIIGESHLFKIASLKEEILAEEDFQICQKKKKI
jgi:hypothetical protein